MKRLTGKLAERIAQAEHWARRARKAAKLRTKRREFISGTIGSQAQHRIRRDCARQGILYDQFRTATGIEAVARKAGAR